MSHRVPPPPLSRTAPRLHHNTSFATAVFTLELQAQSRQSLGITNTLVSFKALRNMASLDGAAGVSGQQRLHRQIKEPSMRQTRSEILNSKRADLMTSMLYGLLDRVGHLTGVGPVEEEADGSVAASAIGAARFRGQLRFQEIRLPSPNDDGVNYAHSRTATLARP